MAAEPIRGLGHMDSSDTFYEANSGSQPSPTTEEASAGAAKGRPGPLRQAAWQPAKASSRWGLNSNRAAMR